MISQDSRSGSAAAHGVAEALIGILPRLRELHGQTVVVVAGHPVLADEGLRHAFCGDIAFLRYSGMRPVVVHDGGPRILTRPENDAAALRRYVAGYVQRELVGLLNDRTPFAVGITGEDGRTLTVLAGEDLLVDAGVLRVLLDSGRIPVVSSIAYGSDGGIHHLEATPAAVSLASALGGSLVLPVGDGGPADATFIDMSVPHAVLRHLHRL
ncbi:hypothetical protein [Streptomyces sp. A5-4]|uniref:amino acid kinase family protein n=1 Tax=Streptomyces sp. A5-4 TaxID=3384771 RepID=UPI003DA87A4D